MAKKHNSKKFYKNSRTTSTVTTVAENGEMEKFLYLFGTEKGEARRKAELSAYVPKDVENYRSYLVKRGMRLLDDAKSADKEVTQFQIYLVSDEADVKRVPNIFYDPQPDYKSEAKDAFNSIKEEFEATREKMHEDAAKKAAEQKPAEEKKPAVKAAASKTSAPASAKDWTPNAAVKPAAKPDAKKVEVDAACGAIIKRIVAKLATKSEAELLLVEKMLG